MKKRSAILPTFAIPVFAFSLVSCEIQRDVTPQTANIDDGKMIADTTEQKEVQAELVKAEAGRDEAEKAIDKATRDLADVNAKIAKLEGKLAELQTQGVSLATYESPGGASAAPDPEAEPVTPTPEPEPEPEPVTPTPEPVTPEVATTDNGGGAAAAGMMDLVTEFPIPMFIGTPVPVKLPNLEPPGKPKLTMPVPVGTSNVALNKPVTSSDPEPTIGDLEFVTDGDKDGGDGFFVELGFDTQWVQIDLEKEYNVHAIVVWHFHKAACAYYDVVVQVSNDPEFKEAVTVYNNDHDNSSSLGVGQDLAYIETNHGRIIDAKGAKGRYVRLYSNGNTANDLNHYIEVEVHATE